MCKSLTWVKTLVHAVGGLFIAPEPDDRELGLDHTWYSVSAWRNTYSGET